MNILITGASIGGIGFETALQLASQGHKLFITSRTLERSLAASDAIFSRTVCIRPEAFSLDLSESDSIVDFIGKLKDKTDSIHILINNAGFMKTKRSVNSRNIEMSLAVNYYGTKELTELLLPLLTRRGRIINVSSSTASMGRLSAEDSDKKWSGFRAYFNSKYALNLYTRQLAHRLNERGITVNALHPGNIITNIWMDLWPHNKILKFIISLINKTGIFSVQKGALTTIYLALSPEVENQTDGYYKNSHFFSWPSNCRDLEKNRTTLLELHQYHTV